MNRNTYHSLDIRCGRDDFFFSSIHNDRERRNTHAHNNFFVCSLSFDAVEKETCFWSFYFKTKNKIEKSYADNEPRIIIFYLYATRIQMFLYTFNFYCTFCETAETTPINTFFILFLFGMTMEEFRLFDLFLLLSNGLSQWLKWYFFYFVSKSIYLNILFRFTNW